MRCTARARGRYLSIRRRNLKNSSCLWRTPHPHLLVALLLLLGGGQAAVALRLSRSGLVAVPAMFNCLESLVELRDHRTGWRGEEGLPASGLTREGAKRFMAARRANGNKPWVSPHSMTLRRECLRRGGVVPGRGLGHPCRFEDLFAAYRRYLT